MHRIWRKRQTDRVRDVVARVDGRGVEMPAGGPGAGMPGEARRGKRVGMGMGMGRVGCNGNGRGCERRGAGAPGGRRL